MTEQSLKRVIKVGTVLVALLFVAIFILWFLTMRSITVFDTDQVVNGDYTIAKGEGVVMKNNAKLTVNGDMHVKGKLSCDDGGLELHVNGNLLLENGLECDVKDEAIDDSIFMVVSGEVTFDPNAVVMASGGFQLVDDASKLARSSEEQEALFNAIEQEEGGIQLGPLSTNADGTIDVQTTEVTALAPAPEKTSPLAWFATPVHAQDIPPARVVVQGKLIIGQGETPPEEINAELTEEERKKRLKKVVLNFDFNDDTGVALQNLSIQGPNASHGASQTSGCNARGDNGKDAMRFNGRAGNLTINNFQLTLGSGGNGGDATTDRDCEQDAEARGGNGGSPGNFRIRASQSFQITGAFYITPGKGGDGGVANAMTHHALEACPGKNSANATAIGGNGGDSKQKLRARGSIGGTSNIFIAPAFAGNGGDAIAETGNAGDGEACGCAAGNAGNALARGGNGGNAVTGGDNATFGGGGGDATAYAGDGGDGGMCEGNNGPGGDGGKGGNAGAYPGKAGGGDTDLGDGEIKDSVGGNGGNGGNGCTEGGAGLYGTGITNGNNGSMGENTCYVEEEDDEVLISVIPFGGSYIPVHLVRVAGPDECSGDHWHGGSVTMVNGETVSDPNPGGCGFGALADTPSQEIAVSLATLTDLYGPSITEHTKSPAGGNTSTNAPEDGGCMIQLCMVGGTWIECPDQPQCDE